MTSDLGSALRQRMIDGMVARKLVPNRMDRNQTLVFSYGRRER